MPTKDRNDVVVKLFAAALAYQLGDSEAAALHLHDAVASPKFGEVATLTLKERASEDEEVVEEELVVEVSEVEDEGTVEAPVEEEASVKVVGLRKSLSGRRAAVKAHREVVRANLAALAA